MFQSHIYVFLTIIISNCSPVAATYLGDRQKFFTDLIQKYQLPPNEAAIWNCLADHHSNFESSLRTFDADLNENSYGVFQISGRIWCSDGQNVCGISCQKLLDDDLSDDIMCARRIYKIQGLNAWDAWKRRCQNRMDEYMPQYKNQERCNFARDLHYKESVPASMLATLVCIAEEESGFNIQTKEIFDNEGFGAYGLFKISGKWWCRDNERSRGNCEIPCTALLDNYLTDDIRCAMKIINDTASYRKDQNGFFAWDSYARRCKNAKKNEDMIRNCFTIREQNNIFSIESSSSRNRENLPFSDVTVPTISFNPRPWNNANLQTTALPTSTFRPFTYPTTTKAPIWSNILEKNTKSRPFIGNFNLKNLYSNSQTIETTSHYFLTATQKTTKQCWNKLYPPQKKLALEVEEECYRE